MKTIFEEDYLEGQADFGHRLTTALAKRGVSQNKLSSATGISAGTISEWVSRGVRPDYYSLKRVAMALEVSADYLMGLEDADE